MEFTICLNCTALRNLGTKSNNQKCMYDFFKQRIECNLCVNVAHSTHTYSLTQTGWINLKKDKKDGDGEKAHIHILKRYGRGCAFTNVHVYACACVSERFF